MTTQEIIMNLVPLLVLLVVAYFLIIRPAQTRNKKHEALMAGLKRGDKIVTVGGMHGTVKAVDVQTVTILVGRNQELVFDKAAIKERRPS